MRDAITYLCCIRAQADSAKHMLQMKSMNSMPGTFILETLKSPAYTGLNVKLILVFIGGGG